MERFPYVRNAKARIRGGEQAPMLRGEATFSQQREGVLITVRVQGLPHSDTGFFALHIHEGDSCGGKAFAETGGHYNPGDDLHPMHAGDLPPLLSYHGGKAYLQVITDRFRLHDIINRTLVIHSGTDDFHTQPSGNAGEKIACGVIRRIN